jgi:hypothetical protein
VNNAIYNIIYEKLERWLTPFVLRKAKMMAWIAIIITPAQYIYQDLLRFRKATLYSLSITPQVCMLQKLLNDKYDYSLRRIKIVDAFDYNPVYFFARPELKPTILFNRSENNPVYFFTRGESNTDLSNDFVVEVPKGLSFNLLEMTSLIQTYKLASKKFTIQYV